MALVFLSFTLLLQAAHVHGLRLVDRRGALHTAGAAPAALLCVAPRVARAAAEPPTVTLPSGLSFQDFTVGTGAQPAAGARVTIDYVMQTSGARYGSKIYSTRDAEAPFSFALGDPSVFPAFFDPYLGQE